MTKRITRLEDFVPASIAASLLSDKLHRPIDPDYIHKLKSVRYHTINARCKLYYKPDIEAVNIRQKRHNLGRLDTYQSQ